MSCLIYFIADLVSSKPSSNDPLIPSIDSLLAELPVIIDPPVFCHCLDTITVAHCKQISIAHQLRHAEEIARVWYAISKRPSWDKVVHALLCSNNQNDQDAIQLAKKKGVDWRTLQRN